MEPVKIGKEITRTSKFNKIYILDAPARAGERRSGKELYAWLKNRAIQAEITAERIEIHSKKHLVKVLNELGNEAEQGRFVPVIHFEAHGNTTGMEVRPGELIEWSSLLNLTRRINVATINNLILSFAVCHAGFLYAEIDIFKPAPFYGFVSSIEEIQFGALESGYSSFFDSMLSAGSLNHAVTGLNTDYNVESAEYGVEPVKQEMFDFKLAEMFFENLWYSYEEVWRDEAERKSRMNNQMLLALKDPAMRNKYSIPTLRYLLEKVNTKETRQEIKAEQRGVFMME